MQKIYLNPSHPGSFGGESRLKQHTKLSSKKVKEFLGTQNCYIRHKQRRDKFHRRKVEVHESNYLWQADILFLKHLKKHNNNIAYILTVIDCFSRYAFAIPLKNKTSAEVIRAFDEIFKASNHKPKYLQCDQGKEFFSKACVKFLKVNNIKLYHNNSDFKACVVERFNKTLMSRLSKWITHTNNYRYLEILPMLLKSYNASIHSSIGYKPVDVNKSNEMDVWLNDHKNMFKRKNLTPKFKLNDSVHILSKKETFQKGYMPTYTQEVFVISEILNTHPICYHIKDMSNEPIKGVFYNEELQKGKI